LSKRLLIVSTLAFRSSRSSILIDSFASFRVSILEVFSLVFFASTIPAQDWKNQ